MQTIITSKIFKKHPGIIHGVSTKTDSASPYSNNMSKFVGDDIERVMKNRSEFYNHLGIDLNTAKFAHANQIHSGNVTVLSDEFVNGIGLFKETDALITNQRGIFLVISVADCLPVMIYDTVKQVIANVHSGWRGTAKGIVTNTLHKMHEEFGCNTSDMIAFIGPGISKENFEVGAEVAEMFEEKYVHRPPRSSAPPLLKTEACLQQSGEQNKASSPPLLRGSNRRGRGSESEKFFIDLKSVVFSQLITKGIKLENIDKCPYCTFSEKDMLHSYRRDKDSSGRMFAVIGLR